MIMKGRYFTFLVITLLGASTPAFAQTLVIFKDARSIKVDSARYENNQCIYTKNGSEKSGPLSMIEEIYVLNQGRIYPPAHPVTKKTQDTSITSDEEEPVEQTQIYKPPLGNATNSSATEADTVRLRTANALRAGNIDLALKGFARDEKSQTIIPALSAAKRNEIADLIEKAQAIYTSESDRAYRYDWTDEAGNIRHTEFIMGRNKSGQWHIISW